jgi:hypothetical protein
MPAYIRNGPYQDTARYDNQNPVGKLPNYNQNLTTGNSVGANSTKEIFLHRPVSPKKISHKKVSLKA